MMTEGALNSISAARTGSIATKAISHSPVLTASKTLPAAGYVTSSTGTPSRRPSWRARSGVMPLASPVAGVDWASTELPRFVAGRRFPGGAGSLRVAAVVGSDKDADTLAQANASASSMVRDDAVKRPPTRQWIFQ